MVELEREGRVRRAVDRAMISRLIAALALFAAPALADRAWSSSLEPLHAGELELGGGPGAVWQAGRPWFFGSNVAPGLILAARWGINDNLQLVFPLSATLSADLGGPLAPRVALSAGIEAVAIGVVGDVVNVAAAPAVAASAHWVGRSSALILQLDAATWFGTASYFAPLTTLGGGAGWAFRVDDQLSIGFSAHVHGSVASFAGETASSVRIGIGSIGGFIPNAVPTVRYLLTATLSLEAWLSVDFVNSVGPSYSYTGALGGGALASVTWRL